MEKIAVIGSGGFGREVKTLIDAINQEKPTYEIIGFFDDKYEKNSSANGLPILGNLDSLNKIDYPLNIVLGVGDPRVKESIVKGIKNNKIKFPTLIHPSTIVSNDEVVIGKGTIICAGTIVTCNIRLDDFVTLNLCCTVGHDTAIGNYSSFMPSVNISGDVDIKEKVYVGTGVKIINLLSIGENPIIGAGAVVAKSIPANCTAVGIPAKPIKFH